jgi:hypothetical protein
MNCPSFCIVELLRRSTHPALRAPLQGGDFGGYLLGMFKTDPYL